jgi:hypothetical protein
MEHDQRFKVLIQEFLREFLGLFFPELLPYLDLSQISWLQQEIYPYAPEGLRLTIDLLARVPLLPAAAALLDRPHFDAILIHIEIESADTVEPFRRRMYRYFHFLTEQHELSVLPIAVYLRVGLEGRGNDVYEVRVLDRTPLRFEYDYVGLPGLEGPEYLHRDNSLGIAWSALMRWPRPQRAQAAVAALDRIVAGTESPARKMLLCECVQAYAPLDDAQRVELYSLLQEPQNQGVRAMVKTWSEVAKEEGQKEGEAKGKRDLVLKLLKARFPDLSPTAQQRVKEWPVEKVEEVGIALLTARSLRDLGLEV